MTYAISEKGLPLAQQTQLFSAVLVNMLLLSSTGKMIAILRFVVMGERIGMAPRSHAGLTRRAMEYIILKCSIW